MEDKDVLTTRELLEEFGEFFSSASQVAKLAKAGVLPHWRISARNLRFRRCDVQAFLDARYVSGRSRCRLAGKLAGKIAIA